MHTIKTLLTILLWLPVIVLVCVVEAFMRPDGQEDE